MPNTTRTHFDEDITRAEELATLANDLERGCRPEPLWRDVSLSSVAMAVGAMDAYFCDKYVDCLTCALRKYSRNEWVGRFPAGYGKTLIPAGHALDRSRTSRPHWGIRMASRDLMAKDNMYSLSKVPDAFNPILPAGQKLWNDLIEAFIRLNRRRLVGTDWATYNALGSQPRIDARRRAVAHLLRRVGSTVQRRHDWIHNCGRPKAAIQSMTNGQATTGIAEVRLLVTTVDDHIEQYRLA